MRKLLGIGLALFIVCGFSGCGSGGPEAQVKEMISLLNQLSDALESIKDDASADAAIPKIESIAEKLSALGKRMKEEKPSKEEDKRLQEKYQKEVMDAQQRMQKAIVSAALKAPGKAMKLQEAFKKSGMR
jgi:hypothetical protein